MGLCRIHIRIYLCLFCALSCRRRPNSVRPTGIAGAPRRLLSDPPCARVSGQSHVAIGQNQDSGLREFQIQNEGRATRRPETQNEGLPTENLRRVIFERAARGRTPADFFGGSAKSFGGKTPIRRPLRWLNSTNDP